MQAADFPKQIDEGGSVSWPPRPAGHIGRGHFQELNWLPVKARVSQLRLSVVHNISNHRAPRYLQNQFTPVSESHNHRTRGSVANFRLPRLHTKLGKSAFIYKGVKDWNDLPTTMKQSQSLPSFKIKVKKWLMEKVPA